mmetsp:Transcript_109422/g.265967  ORF Transcript_109422/g.265967 Transcript_109422/m.265967 type:complete len:225 (-) Transcript_109422:64-738(-)
MTPRPRHWGHFLLFVGAHARLDDVIGLMQQRGHDAAPLEARVMSEALEAPESDAHASLLEIQSSQEPHGPRKTPAEQITELKGRVHSRLDKVMTGVNKGISSVNSRVEHSVGNMMSRANGALDDVHSAASNALQGVKDFTDAASDPVAKKVNEQAGKLNSKVKLMIAKINGAVEEMKSGVHDLAHGVTTGMKEASEKIAAQLAQSVHEHVRQEIELARASEPAS